MPIKSKTSKIPSKRGPYRKCPPDITISAYIPANFDFDAHILLWPTPDGVTKDKVHYFLDLILRLPLINYDLLDANGFVSLSAKKMQRNITDYKMVLQYLTNSEIILCRPWYKPQLQSKGYKVINENSNGNIKKVLIIEDCVRKAIWAEKAPQQEILYPHFEWSLSGLRVNKKVLREYIDTDYEKKRNDPTLREQKNKKFIKSDGSKIWAYTPVDIIYQKQSGIMVLEEILESRTNGIGLRGFVDATGGRFHHTISRMKKEHRNTLDWHGQKIVGYDIGCSQFFLFNRLCDVDFWDCSGDDVRVTIKDLPEKFLNDFINTPCSGNKKVQSKLVLKSIFDAIIFTLNKVFGSGQIFRSSLLEGVTDKSLYASIHVSPIVSIDSSSIVSTLSMLLNCSDDLDVIKLQEELKHFETLTCDGTLYQGYEDLVLQRTGTIINRRQAKDSMCQTFFSSNRFYKQDGGELKRAFSRVFPALMEFIKLLKTGKKSEAPHARLPIILQAIEAEIILNRICKRIEIERPGMPLIPLHDGLFTNEVNALFLGDIMAEELFKATGRRPTLRREEWSLEKLQYCDDEMYLNKNESRY